VETNELTPSLKLKRSVAAKIWAKEIEAMYPADTAVAGA